MRDVFEQMKERPRWDAVYEGFRAYERFLGAERETVPDDVVCIEHGDVPHVLKPAERLFFHFEGAECGEFYEGDVFISFFDGRADDMEPVFEVAFHRVEHCWGEAFYHLRAMVRGQNVSVLHDVRSDGQFYAFLVAQGERRAAEVFTRLWRLKPSLLIFDDVSLDVVGQTYS